jgi:hypothetical protein
MLLHHPCCQMEATMALLERACGQHRDISVHRMLAMLS